MQRLVMRSGFFFFFAITCCAISCTRMRANSYGENGSIAKLDIKEVQLGMSVERFRAIYDRSIEWDEVSRVGSVRFYYPCPEDVQSPPPVLGVFRFDELGTLVEVAFKRDLGK